MAQGCGSTCRALGCLHSWARTTRTSSSVYAWPCASPLIMHSTIRARSQSHHAKRKKGPLSSRRGSPNFAPGTVTHVSTELLSSPSCCIWLSRANPRPNLHNNPNRARKPCMCRTCLLFYWPCALRLCFSLAGCMRNNCERFLEPPPSPPNCMNEEQDRN